jgi:hypothetical protein
MKIIKTLQHYLKKWKVVSEAFWELLKGRTLAEELKIIVVRFSNCIEFLVRPL